MSPVWAEEERDPGSRPVSAAAVLCDFEGGTALSEPQPSCCAIFQTGGCEAEGHAEIVLSIP